MTRTALCISTKRLDGAVAIVTGANSGIGLETCADLARRGATVVMACRNAERAESARQSLLDRFGINSASSCTEIYFTPIEPHQLQIEILDLASLQSVREFGNRSCSKFPEVRFLINNAGLSSPHCKLTEDGLEMTMACNHLGHFLLTNLLLPSLRNSADKTGDARIICVSSALHKKGVILEPDLKLPQQDYGELVAYSNSKLANVMHARELAIRLRDTGISVYSVHPGLVYTNIWKGPMKIFAFFATLFMKSPLQGAQTSLYCTLTDGLESGGYFADCAPGEMLALAKDDSLCSNLFDISTRLTTGEPVVQSQGDGINPLEANF